jgi:hypothetical protein
MSDEVSDEFRQAVAEMTGVPVQMCLGETPHEVWQSAQTATEWKQAGQPSLPPIAAVSASTVSYASSGSPLDGRIVGPPQVLSRSKLAAMDPAARMAAWKAGQPGIPRSGLTGR